VSICSINSFRSFQPSATTFRASGSSHWGIKLVAGFGSQTSPSAIATSKTPLGVTYL